MRQQETKGVRQSARPTVFVEGAKKAEVRDALSHRMALAGWSVTEVNEYQVTYETAANGAVGFMTRVAYGSRGTDPVWRLVGQFIETESGVRLVANLEVVANPGTPFMQKTEMNSGKPRKQVDQILEAVRLDTEKASRGDSAPADSPR
jgi:hypothetical protein